MILARYDEMRRTKMAKTLTDPASDELMAQIRELAKTAVNHRLPDDMLGTRPLARQAALMVLTRLRAKQPTGRAPQTVQFVEPADESGPAIERDPTWPRWLHVPPGIYFYESNVYRVYKSQYPPHYWMCKLLDIEAAQTGGSRWISVKG